MTHKGQDSKQIHLLTLNINGLQNDNKRLDLFQQLKNKAFDIIFLQETHTIPETSLKWEKDWTGKSIWHSGPNPKASGIAILFKQNLNFDIIRYETDSDGRIIKCFIQIQDQIFQLINIYAPTNPKNKKIFYNELPKIIENENNTIIAGDFNMIEDFSLDKLGGNKSSIHTIGLEKINKIKNKHNLIDIWRKTNPTKKIFTYHNPDKTIHTRLDRIYTSKKIKITTSKIQPTSLSDHDGVSVTFQINEENPRGTGTWKMNTSILQQNQFKEIFLNFWNYWQNEKIKYKNQNAWWDAGKIYIKAITIDFCTRKNKQINKKQQDLISYITQEKSKTSPNIEKINKLQQELDDIENYKT